MISNWGLAVRLYTISQREEVIVKSEEVLFKLACGRVCSLLIPSYLLTFTSVSLQANSPLNPNLSQNHFQKAERKNPRRIRQGLN